MTSATTNQSRIHGQPTCIMSTTTTTDTMKACVESGMLAMDGTKSGVIGTTCADGSSLMLIEKGDRVQYLESESEDRRIHVVDAVLEDDDGYFIKLAGHPSDAPMGYRYDGLWGHWWAGENKWIEAQKFQIIEKKIK